MQLYLKLALGNVRRSARDYSVYFATLGFAACLLYSFVASTDHLRAMGLSPEQLGVLGSAGDILQAFSVFTVLVFLFLVRYANRFLLRRRKREFALYELCGMGRGAVSVVLVAETALVGAGALACGLAAGAALSPAFGAVAAFVFDAPWRLAFSFSPDSAAWTAGCFAVVFAVNAVDSARAISRGATPIELMSAERAPGAMRLGGRVARGGQAVVALVLLAVVWGACLLQPVYFIAFIIPMGFAACFATSLIARLGVAAWGERARGRSERYWDGLTAFTVRQVEARVSSTSMALACVCVLVAVAVCMMVAGFVFSIGLRTPEMVSAGIAASMAPIGYIGIFYGAVFLLSAVAVLALLQLSGAVDARRAYGVLGQLGCDRALCARPCAAQLALYFAAPLAGALVHDVFGLFLVAFLAFALGAEGLFAIVAGVLAFTIGLMATYGAITARAVERVVLSL
ncbi:MAG: FtsX-like permease family protein [Collinsella sp.]